MLTTYATADLTRLRDALEAELLARETQMNILCQTLENLVSAGAPDSVLETVLAAIDILEVAQCSAPDEPDEPVIEQDLSDEGIRKDYISYARSRGYTGAGFDALVTAEHKDMAYQEYMRAEDACRGHLVRPEYQNTYDPQRLWFCNVRELQKYASDELLTWFDENGRLTRASFYDRVMGRKHYAGSGYLMGR